MKAPEELLPETLVLDLMQLVRRLLYQGKPEKTWFAQQEMVKKALLHPAVWLHERKVEIPARRYKAIMEAMLTTMATRGNLAEVTYISRYVLHCVQEHMRHHGDTYYREGVGVRNLLRIGMTAVEKARIGADSTVPVLAEASAKVLQVAKRKGKVKADAVRGLKWEPTQPDLFK